MRELLAAIKRRWFSKRGTYVLMTLENGQQSMLGPTDRFTAEVLLVSVIAQHPYHYGRRVVSARLVSE